MHIDTIMKQYEIRAHETAQFIRQFVRPGPSISEHSYYDKILYCSNGVPIWGTYMETQYVADCPTHKAI